MAKGILETILANQILILAKLGINPEASGEVLTGSVVTGPGSVIVGDAGNVMMGAASTGTTTPLQGNTPGIAGTQELDAAGLPWDDRIHSSSKEKLVKDSTWKLKRGVDKTVVAQVEAQYRAGGYIDPRNTVNVATPGTAASAAAPNVPPANTGALDAGGLPGLPGGMPAPVTPPVQVKVEMPVYQQGVEIDDTLLTTIASAFYAEWGEAALLKALALFQLPEGSAVTAITEPAHRDSFWRLVTTPQYLEQYGFVKAQA